MHMSLKIGIIGFGGMAHWHATNASKIEGVDFVAAYDVDEKQLQSAQEEFGMRPCRTLEELLSIPEINFVLVATPNQIHKDMVIAALRAEGLFPSVFLSTARGHRADVADEVAYLQEEFMDKGMAMPSLCVKQVDELASQAEDLVLDLLQGGEVRQ